MRRTTILGLGLWLLSCKQPTATTEPASSSGSSARTTPSATAVAEPTLAPDRTGFASSDADITLDRCKKTSWSYHGCPLVYPIQGRQWIEYECSTEKDPKIKPIVCERLAEFRIHGIGGPIERKEGIAALRSLCSPEYRVACASLALELVWTDRSAAKPLAKIGCDDDPRNSPVGLCDTLHSALSDAYHAYAFTAADVKGLDGVKVGAKCSAVVLVGSGKCTGHVACGDRLVYGNGSFPCKGDAASLTGGESMTSPKDGDPAISIDVKAKTIEVHDDAAAKAPAFSLRGSLLNPR